MAFLGLWMYNSAKGDVERGENKMRRVEAARDMMLPSTKAEERMMSGIETPPLIDTPVDTTATTTTAMDKTTAYGRPRNMSITSHRPPIHHHTPHLQLPVSQPHNHNLPDTHSKLPPPPGSTFPPTMISIPKRGVASLLDSYPSPPASLDDTPPSSPTPFPYTYSIPQPEPRVPQTHVAA